MSVCFWYEKKNYLNSLACKCMCFAIDEAEENNEDKHCQYVTDMTSFHFLVVFFAYSIS